MALRLLLVAALSAAPAPIDLSSGDRVALLARLALRQTPGVPELPYVLFSDNYANLLPGQSINATAALTSTAPRGQSLLVCAEAWNAPEKCARSARLSVKMDDEAFPPHASAPYLFCAGSPSTDPPGTWPAS